MKMPAEYIDVNGLVKPQVTWTNSGNGLCYTGTALVLGFEIDDYQKNVRDCYYHVGCLMRTDDNGFGQESYDDYLGTAAGCIAIGETKIPQEIIVYGLSNFFVFKTTTSNTLKDWLKAFLGRFPQVWLLMFPAAFPWLKWLFALPLMVMAYFLKGAIEDQSGTILQWQIQKSVVNLYGIKYFYNRWIKRNGFSLKNDIFGKYFNKGHPFIDAIGE